MRNGHSPPPVQNNGTPSAVDHGPVAGPSNSNGHVTTNGYGDGSGYATPVGVRTLELPGREMYPDSTVDREEFVRLVLQGLRDVGYNEAAATLEAESGYHLEADSVADFRDCVLEGRWDRVEGALASLGVVMEEDVRYARFLVCEQKFLEHLERRQMDQALYVLRSEISPLQQEPERTHVLSSLIMCDPKDLYTRADWDGSRGSSRQTLLTKLQRFIPSYIMIPPRRLETLLNQARHLQTLACIYHTSTRPFSLYTDHQCDRTEFPLHTTHVLADHQDEVWHLAWSHDGNRLATASRDQSVIIYRIGPDLKDIALEQRLREHAHAVSFVAWSPDDSILLTAAEATIKMWNPKTGLCIKTILGHEDTVSGLSWRSSGLGFVSGGMDQKVLFWDKEGRRVDSIDPVPTRMSSLTISPDERWLIIVGLLTGPPKPTSRTASSVSSQSHSQSVRNPASSQNPALAPKQKRFAIYDLKTKQEHANVSMSGEITSVVVSSDSKFVLVNHAPDELQLWSLEEPKLVRKYTGQRQGKHVIRSCFGGIAENFVLSGSEDGNVYVWHKESGTPLEILQGHGGGSVNAIAWNPCQEAMFASCSDDHTVRIWSKHPPTYPADPADVIMDGVAAGATSREPATLRWDDAREMFV